MSQHYELRASPETCHWGFFDAGLKPVLTVASGDTVTMDCVSGGPDVLPQDGKFEILPDHLPIQRALEPRLGAHILTGPISVEGAEPGDVLEIQILAIDPRQNWGYTRIRPLSGTLPEDFPIRRIWHTAIDRQRGIATVPAGVDGGRIVFRRRRPRRAGRRRGLCDGAGNRSLRYLPPSVAQGPEIRS